MEEDGDTRAPFGLELLRNKGIGEYNSLLIYRFLKVASAFAKVTANETLSIRHLAANHGSLSKLAQEQ